MQTTQLLERLEAIGQSLAKSGRALALLGLGSVGLERERLDEYSDLDFFAIVKPGEKQYFLETLSWLSDIAPIGFAVRNTVDGYKVLYKDGIFCEFAIFEPDELARIPFAKGQLVWKAEGVDDSLATPIWDEPKPKHPEAFLLGEALTNLYVGLGRNARGEQLSAARFIQQFAVDCALELAARREEAQAGQADRFSLERRFEQRFPHTSSYLPSFVQGYARNRESALAILSFLEANWEVNPHIAAAIRERADV